MTHKAWCNLEEVPYNFLRSSIKFKGHTGWKIDDLNLFWGWLLGRSQLSNPSDLPCYLKHTYLIIHLLMVHGSWCSFFLCHLNKLTHPLNGVDLLTITERSRHPLHRHCGESPEGPHSRPSAKGCRKGGEGGSNYSGCDCRRTSRYFNCTQSNTIRCGWTCVTILLAANLAISY